MCVINFIQRQDNTNISEKDLAEFNKLMVLGSLRNRNAFGLFNRNYVYKQDGEFNTFRVNEKKLLKSDFLVGHNRLSTSGFNPTGTNSLPIYHPWGLLGWVFKRVFEPKWLKKDKLDKDIKVETDNNINNHPFILNNLIMVHNGVIYNHESLRERYNIPDVIKTDSFVMLYLINLFMEQSRKGSRKERLVEAIKRATKRVWGSYSIFLYDRVDDRLIYFKEDSTSMHFYLINDSILVGSSDNNFVRYTYFNFPNRKKLPLYSNTIYEITNSKEPLKEIGNFSLNFFGLTEEDDINTFFEEEFGFPVKTKLKKDKIYLKADKKIKPKEIPFKYKKEGKYYVLNKKDVTSMKGGLNLVNNGLAMYQWCYP